MRNSTTSPTKVNPVNSFLMKKYFNNRLTERELDLLSGKVSLIDFIHLLSDASAIEQLKIIICYISGKQGKLDTLPAVLHEHLSPELIVKAFALTGQFDLIKQIKMTSELLKKILERSDIGKSLISMETGSSFIDYLNFDISGNLKIKDIFISGHYRNFIALSVQNGHLDILTYVESILGKAKVEEAIAAKGFEVYQLAAKNGHLGKESLEKD
jgi:hypothetical protein